MKTTKQSLEFIKESKTILFNGQVVVDMSLVPESAKATFFSGVNEDNRGYDTDFRITDSRSPFDLQVASLSLRGFIMAIVKNRLQIEGMIVSESINDTYMALA